MKRKAVVARHRVALLEQLEVRRLLSAIVADSSFESVKISSNSAVYNPSGSPWTFTSTAGIINSPSSFSAPAAPDGKQIAFLQANHEISQYNGSQDGTISQSVSLPSTGYYTLTLDAAADAGDVGGNVAAEESFMLTIDGAPVLTGLHPASSAFVPVSGTFSATAGTHTIALVSTSPDDHTTFIDQVQLTPYTAGAPAQLVFTSVPQSIAAGVKSSAITVQLEDSSGLAVAAPTGGISVSLASNSSQGFFFNAGGILTSTATISAGSNSATFYYKDAAAGSPTLSASATGLTAASQTQSVQAVTANSFLHTSGTNIVNSSGQTIELRGVNLGSLFIMEGWMSPLDSSGLPDEYGVIQSLDNRFGVTAQQSLISTYQQNWINLQDLQNIKDEGFNVIRVPVWWGDFETLRGQWRSDAFQQLDWLVNTAGAMGIYTIIDMHGAVGGQSLSDDTGQANLNQYWSSAYDQQQTDVIMKNIAMHYSANPMVAGYDLLNEPDNAPSDSAVISAEGQIYSAVRSADTNHIAFIEGTFDQWNWSMLPAPSSQGWSNVVYEMHEYQWNDTSNPSGVEAGTNNQVSDFKNHSSYNVPDYVGEFNDFGTGSSTWQYTFQQYDNNNISWSFWSYKATAGNASSQNSWGLYDPVGSLTDPNIQSDSQAAIAQDWSNVTTAGSFAINTMLQSALSGAGVNAGIDVWTGINSNNWLDRNNWSTSAIPTATSQVIINSGTPIASAPFSVASLQITGGELQLASNSGSFTVNALNITNNGTLDLTNNKLLVNFGSSADPFTSIAAYIRSGFNGGAWSGDGITSSSAAANTAYGLGFADGADATVLGLTSGQIEVAYTLLGDANLDGKVNGADFAIVASYFNQSVTGWDQADFNYDAKVNGADFADLAANFNQGASQAAVATAPAAVLTTTVSNSATTSAADAAPPKKTTRAHPHRKIS
jgi:aryl-phospho-beta-D-glucosidase BglC (GH1 family)